MCFKYLKLISSFIIILFLVKGIQSDDVPKSKVVKCAVCNSLVHEIQQAILKVDPRKTVEYGSFRINPDGRQVRETKKYAGSETHMTEMLETVCGEFQDYAQARHKETNMIEAIKLVVDGKMNPRFGEYEMIQDPDLNKGLKFHCESIVEDFEDEIVEFFASESSKNTDREEKAMQDDFCSHKTSICVGIRDEL